MGGCASKPKELDVKPESVPTEAPAVPEGETVVVAREEAPLVDLSEPKEEAVEVADVETTTEEATEKPSEENVEVVEPVKEEESAAAAVPAEAESSEDKSDAPLVTV